MKADRPRHVTTSDMVKRFVNNGRCAQEAVDALLVRDRTETGDAAELLAALPHDTRQSYREGVEASGREATS